MKEERRLIRDRQRLAQQLPDPSTVLAGSLMSRMIRCNKPGCRFCGKGKGKGHGPIWILSVSAGRGRARQTPIPQQLRKEVEEGLCRWKEVQQQLQRISQINQQLLRLRKRR